MPDHERKFYYEYSDSVFSELSTDKVQDILNHVMEKEELDPCEAEDIRVMRFPFGASKAETDYLQRSRINIRKGQYFGNYLPALKRVSIYPPRFQPEFIWSTHAKQIWYNENLRYLFFCFEPVKTVIHEVLLMKYGKDENTVDRLSRKYMVESERRTIGQIRYSRKKTSFFTRL